MALAASAFRIAEGGTRHQALVRKAFIRRIRIAAMAGFASDLAVIAVQKFSRHQNLFLRLQRSHGSASAGPGGQGRFLFFFLAEVGCQSTFFRVAGHTSGLGR